jgi:hypothetical protein
MNSTTRPRIIASSRARRAWFATFLAAPALVLALTGCTLGGSDAAAPGSGSSTGTAADQPGTDAEFKTARDAYDRKLAECFRDQGLDVKDPLPGEGIAEDTPEVRDAYPTCAAEIGDPPSSAGVTLTAEELDKLLDRASCLRDLGYEIQEPTATNPGFVGGEVTEEDFETCHTGAGF